MIGHEAISQYIAVGQPLSPYFFEKEKIVVSIEKNDLLIITSVVDMIDAGGFEVHEVR